MRSLLASSLTCLTLTVACTTLRPVEPNDLRGPNPPDRVRVSETNDSTVDLRAPRLTGDTLVEDVDGKQRALPLSGIAEIDGWTADPGRTAAAVVFGGGAAALTYLVIEAGISRPAVCNVTDGPFGSEACPADCTTCYVTYLP
jgi:hypothetical protein